MSVVVQVSGLTKTFKRYNSHWDRLKELLTGRCQHTRHGGLTDVSFAVHAGETLGVLGCNGAGKSTLLKLINGVLLADSGSIQCKGKITGLLELGTGFDLALSGRQNILNNGLLIGMTVAEIEAARDDIIAFSELAEAIDEPVRTYSSGMTMRLAFAIAIHAQPDCFLVDEALSVGDGHFQQKCMRRIRQFREQGGAIIFVSHDLSAVKMLCNRAIVLNEGGIALEGAPEQAVNYYNQLMAKLDEREAVREGGYGNSAVLIQSASIKGERSAVSTVSSGEWAQLTFHLQAQQDISDLTLGLMIRDRFGQDVFGTNTHHLGQPLQIQAGEQRAFACRLKMELAPGKYTITAALHSEHDHSTDCYHWCDNLLGFEVAGINGEFFSGLCRLPVSDIEYSSAKSF